MENIIVDLGRLELREVDDGHELDGLCVPYGVETRKVGPRPERFAAHAFAGISIAASKIRLVDENHTYRGRRPVGVARAFDDEESGLVGRFRFYDTPEGRSAFENVRAGTYGGLSIGFVATRERFVSGVREIIAAKLHHVSLVDEPAYDDAQIIAVRAARPAWTTVHPNMLDIRDIPLLTPLMKTPR